MGQFTHGDSLRNGCAVFVSLPAKKAAESVIRSAAPPHGCCEAA
jgi:hypothetical protein